MLHHLKLFRAKSRTLTHNSLRTRASGLLRTGTRVPHSVPSGNRSKTLGPRLSGAQPRTRTKYSRRKETTPPSSRPGRVRGLACRPPGNSRVGARTEDCLDQSWEVRRAPRSWAAVPGSRYPLSPRLSPQPLEFGSYHCGQSTLQPPGVDKMARGPGARGVSGPRTQGAGPEENPGGRAAQRTWYLHLASLLRSVRCCRSTSALAEVIPGRGTPIGGVLHLKNADLCP